MNELTIEETAWVQYLKTLIKEKNVVDVSHKTPGAHTLSITIINVNDFGLVAYRSKGRKKESRLHVSTIMKVIPITKKS